MNIYVVRSDNAGGSARLLVSDGVIPSRPGDTSDGYINSRVAMVDKNGNWLKSWGEPGDRSGQFSVPNSIAVDATGNVYVADRGNRRIQVFDGRASFFARSPSMYLSMPTLVPRSGRRRVRLFPPTAR